MHQEFSKHPKAYVILIMGLIILGLAFFAVWPARQWQRAIAVALGLFYFSWGYLTHRHDYHLTKRIVYEYGSFALLAGLLLVLITF